MERKIAAYFNGKRILITGGACGIGAEMAKRMLEAGATVRVADWSADRLGKARKRFEAFGGRVSFENVDVSKQAQVDDMVRRMAKDFDGFDMIVNNAGILDRGPAENITLERFRQVMDVNFWGVLYGCYAALPLFLAQGHGHIVNTSSLGGILHAPFQAAYGASKAAVFSFSDTLRYEMELRGIDVSTICPGDVQSGLFLNSLELTAPEQRRKLVKDGYPNTGMGGDEKDDLYEEHGAVNASTKFACTEIMRGLAERAPIILTPLEHMRDTCNYGHDYPYAFHLWGQDLLRVLAKTQREALDRTGNVYGVTEWVGDA